MFASLGILPGLGGLACFAALVLGGLRLHRVGQGQPPNPVKALKAKKASMVVGLAAGCLLLATTIGSWVTGWGLAAGLFAGAALILDGGVVVADWWLDGKPDKPAFWAAVFLPLLLCVGLAQIPTVGNMISGGAGQVGTSVATVR